MAREDFTTYNSGLLIRSTSQVRRRSADHAIRSSPTLSQNAIIFTEFLFLHDLIYKMKDLKHQPKFKRSSSY